MILILITIPNILKAERINTILAHVGNKIITDYDARNLDEKQYTQILNIEDEELRSSTMKEYISQVVTYLIDQYVVEIAASREGITVSDMEVEQVIVEILTRNKLTIEQLEKSLSAEGLTMAKYKYQLRNEILSSRVRNQILMPKIIVVNKDLIDIVNASPDDYNLYDRYEVRIILTDKKKDISKVIKQFKSGDNFSELAKEFSTDATSSDGGYMGFMDYELLSEEMQDALKDIEVGSISETFEINDKWGVFYLISKEDKYDFDTETKAALTEKAMEKQFNLVFQNWLERSRESTVIIRK